VCGFYNNVGQLEFLFPLKKPLTYPNSNEVYYSGTSLQRDLKKATQLSTTPGGHGK